MFHTWPHGWSFGSKPAALSGPIPKAPGFAGGYLLCASSISVIDGISDFNGLHSRRHDAEVQVYAFDVLVSDGEDLRRLPLSLRKANLARLLARRVDGIFLSDFEQGEIGPDLFRHACLMGLEGLVSKHRERTYRAGRSDHWVKVKNRRHVAFNRMWDQFG
jgi:bifunctional non-homologous end joining protein LigD